MASNELFTIILTKHPPARHLFTHRSQDSLFFFAYVDNVIYISKFKLDDDDSVSDSKQAFSGESLKIENVVINIFFSDGKYYGVDNIGTLFSITQEAVVDADIEHDLFDDSPEKSEKWVISSKISIASDQIVLSSCLYEDSQVALIVSTPGKISLDIADITDGTLNNSYHVRSPGIPKESSKSLCQLRWIPSEEVVDEFFKSWFQANLEKSGFFLMTMPEGVILALFPATGQVEYLYVWPDPYILCSSDISSLPDCELVKICSITLISTNGSVLKMTDDGEVINQHSPIHNIKNAYIDGSNFLYLTDWSSSYRLSLQDQSKPTIKLPLKGILCWTGWGTKYCLGLSKNGELYCVNNTSELDINKMSEILPSSSLTTQLINKSEALEKINRQISEVDAYLTAIGLVNINIEFSMSAKTAYVRKSEYTICLEIECLTKGVSITKENWLLHVTLGPSPTYSSSVSYKLRQDLGSGRALVQFITNRNPPIPLSQLKVYVKLIYAHQPSSSTYIPLIFVGEVFLDSSYFIQHANEVDESFQPPVPDLNAVIQNREPAPARKAKKKSIKLKIPLGSEYPVDDFFKHLLGNCRPLWRTTLWDSALKEKKMELMIANKLVTMELENTNVTISGNPEACYMMKQAVFFTSPREVCFKLDRAEALSQLESLKRSCELQTHMDNPSMEKIEEIHQLLRKNITSHLTFK